MGSNRRTFLQHTALLAGGVLSRGAWGEIAPSSALGVARWRPSRVDGGGFQQALAVSNPAHGHTANLVLYAADVAGVHLSTDGGLTFQQCNEGLKAQYHRKLVAIEFDKHSANCVLAYFSNGELGDTTPADDIGRRAGLMYGRIDPVAKTIAWTLLIDQVVTNAGGGVPDYPAGLYPAAADGSNSAQPRQSGRMLACDPFTAGRWYIGTRQGVVLYDRSNTSCSNLARNAVSSGNRDMVTSLAVDPTSTVSSTNLYFTVRAGGMNSGLNRRTGAGPGQSGALTRFSGGGAPTAGEGVVVVNEGGRPVAYVAADQSVAKFDGTAWTSLNAGLTTNASRCWHAIDALRINGGTATRVVVGHYSTDMLAPKLYWSDDGGDTWTAVTEARRSLNIGNATGQRWWLPDAKPYYDLSEYSGGYDAAQVMIRRDAPGQVHTCGRSGGWRTPDITAAGVTWYPAVRGLCATVANFIAPHPTNAGQVILVDVDWARLLSGDRLTSQPLLNEAVFSSPGYGAAWNAAGDAVTCHGDRDTNTHGGVAFNTAPFGGGSWEDLHFSGNRHWGCAIGTSDTGARVVLSVCEGVGIQRKEGIDQPDNPAEVVTVNSVAKAVVDRRHKCPMVWPANGDAVYAYISHGTANPGGLWRSLNRGKSWSLLIPFSTNDRWSSHLIADPSNAARLYFVRRDNDGTASAGVWRVNNANGAHTATRILTLTEPGPIAITHSGRLYAISLPSDSGGSALRYTDNPTVAAPTWVKVTDAFLDGALGYAHHMAAGADGTLYIAKFDGGYLVGDPA